LERVVQGQVEKENLSQSKLEEEFLQNIQHVKKILDHHNLPGVSKARGCTSLFGE
jgi:hypothetical protein